MSDNSDMGTQLRGTSLLILVPPLKLVAFITVLVMWFHPSIVFSAITNSEITSHYKFDIQGRLIEKSSPGDGATHYRYNDQGQMKKASEFLKWLRSTKSQQ